MNSVRQQKYVLRRETAVWQRAAAGLFALSLVCSAGLYGLLGREAACHKQELDKLQKQLQYAEAVRDQAVRELGAVALSSAQEAQARASQAAAYEMIGSYRYVGECVITAYCPCDECCGRWADSLTATGIPAVPGVVAVDTEVIPLGSTVIIDGQRYLAADTGVTGYHVDVCVTSHTEADAAGVRTAEVWVVEP